MKTIILHIGLPKTGSTSLQFLLGENRRALLKQNADFFLGSLARHRFNHVELYLSVLRDGVTTLGHQRFRFEKDVLRKETRERVHRFVNRSIANTLVFSAEGLSFLRAEEELSNLRNLFPPNVLFRIFLVERNAAEWLASWRKQILSAHGRSVSEDPRSALYVEPDTWLTDFRALKRIYRREFQDLTIFPYQRTGLLGNILNEAKICLPADPEKKRYKAGAGNSSRSSSLQRGLALIKKASNDWDFWWRYDRFIFVPQRRD